MYLTVNVVKETQQVTIVSIRNTMEEAEETFSRVSEGLTKHFDMTSRTFLETVANWFYKEVRVGKQNAIIAAQTIGRSLLQMRQDALRVNP